MQPRRTATQRLSRPENPAEFRVQLTDIEICEVAVESGMNRVAEELASRCYSDLLQAIHWPCGWSNDCQGQGIEAYFKTFLVDRCIDEWHQLDSKFPPNSQEQPRTRLTGATGGDEGGDRAHRQRMALASVRGESHDRGVSHALSMRHSAFSSMPLNTGESFPPLVSLGVFPSRK